MTTTKMWVNHGCQGVFKHLLFHDEETCISNGGLVECEFCKGNEKKNAIIHNF